MDGHFAHPHRQQHRPVHDAGDQARRLVEERAGERRDADHAEDAEEERRDAQRRRVVAEEAERRRFRPEEENRFVEERLAAEGRRYVVAALDHLLRDRGVKPFVGIEQRRRRYQRCEDERQRHDEEQAPQVRHP